MGAFIGAFLLMVRPIQALWFIIFIIVIQQIEGNFIYPKVVGTSVGLPGLWVLLAIIVGGGLFGVIGVLLSVPTVAVFTSCSKKMLIKRHPVFKRHSENAMFFILVTINGINSLLAKHMFW